MTASPSPAAEAEVAAITADFDGWHAWLSRADAGRPARVCATRAKPTHPCEPVCTNPEHQPSKPFTGCGETVDADTPGQMRALLTARCGS